MRQRTPIVARDAAELRAAKRAALAAAGHDPDAPEGPVGGPVGVAVVMTMGALHQGHVALLRAARERAAVVLATIFVNPLQFGPTEDLDRYPRALDADLALCAAEGVDVVYVPRAEQIYPNGAPLVRVAAGATGELLEGAFRPGFFDGVLTVVAKLLHLTGPQVAYFGAKDAQQVALVRRMVADLDFDVRIETVPTVREADGLACSSRNRYLSEADRHSAVELYAALRAGAGATGGGAAAVLAAAEAVLARARDASPPVRVDYLALVDPASFRAVGPEHRGSAVLAVAARVGDTRLIDNLTIHLPADADADRHGPRPGV